MSRPHKELFIQLSLNIAYYRRRRGYTQEDLAEKIDISRTHLSNIESIKSDTSLSLDVLFDIADALDVEVGKFFEEW